MAGGGGCTKTASHRWLPQNWKLELHNTFPPMPHCQMKMISSRIVRSAKKGTTGATRGEQHPCYKTHLAFIKCHFRFPVNFDSECQTHAQNHMRCLAVHFSYAMIHSKLKLKVFQTFCKILCIIINKLFIFWNKIAVWWLETREAIFHTAYHREVRRHFWRVI